MKKDFTPKQFMTNNFGNNFITLESMLSADFANQTNEHFEVCLGKAEEITRLFFSNGNFDNNNHKEEVVAVATMCLKMAMIERRVGLYKEEK